MANRGVSLSPIKWFGPIITIIALTNIAILWDIPILRQISGFIFLTFIPGFLFLCVLKLHKLGWVEKTVLAVGLSVAFSMLFGLTLSSSLLALGYAKPLSTTPLLISFSTATITLAAIAYIRNKGITFSLPNLNLTAGEKALLIVPSFFPLLSIVGMRIMNLSDNNIMLMVLLFLIPAYIIFISFFNRRVPERVYPIAIFLTSISLLLMFALRSNHIIGSDIHIEYRLFQTMLGSLHWGHLGFGVLDACLSISVLPTIYQDFLNINPEYLYKLLYALIFSISSLVIYLLSKKYIGSFYAFLASVFFMSQTLFLSTPQHPRTNMAVLFFALAIMVMFHSNISEFNKRALFVIFSVAVIVSHYATAYVVFLALLLTWIGMQILFSIAPRKKEFATLPAEGHIKEGDSRAPPPQAVHHPRNDTGAYKTVGLELPQRRLKRHITIATVALFLAMLFLWYSQATGPSFIAGVQFIQHTFTDWDQFFVTESRGEVVQAGFGSTLPYAGVAQKIEFVVSWLTILFIGIGILPMIGRLKRMVSRPNSEHKKSNFLSKGFEAEYLTLSIVCSALLVFATVFPYVSEHYNISRVYFQMMVPLSIFFVIGGITAAKYLKSRPYVVILVVLVPYFLCTTNIVPQMFDYPRAITLNSEGHTYDSHYVHDQDSQSAKWIGEYATKRTIIYYRGPRAKGQRILSSQAGISPSRTKRLILSYQEGRIDGYIYLEYTDIIDSRVVAEYPDVFAGKGKIYTNSGSEVYESLR